MHLSIVKNVFAESCRVYKYEGGGVMGFLRNILGYEPLNLN